MSRLLANDIIMNIMAYILAELSLVLPAVLIAKLALETFNPC
jgi:hypothetical protein